MRSHTRGFFPEPVAAKVPEITLLFWVIKILTTAGGEATSDYLALDLGSRLEAGCIEAGIFVAAGRVTCSRKVRAPRKDGAG